MSETMDRNHSTTYEEIRNFIETEADLLDRGAYEPWFNLFAEDGIYWVPAQPGQKDPLSYVSLFYDDYTTLKTRVTRLQHPELHCQTPKSQTIRVLSRPSVTRNDTDDYVARCKFIMIEDRIGHAKRLFSGTAEYCLRAGPDGLKIAQKKVELTDCDQSFPVLTIPF